MFDLDRNIRDWCHQMMAQKVATPEALTELESHLREEIERQVHSGSNVKDAFESAVQRLGPAETLRQEFDKIGTRGEWRAHRLLGAILFTFTGLYTGTIFYSLIIHEMTWGERMSGLAAVALMELLLLGIPILYRFLPVFANKGTRRTAQVFCIIPIIIWLLVCFKWILLRFDFDPNQLVVAVLWSLLPMGLGGGLSYGLDEAYYRQHLKA